MTMMGDWLEATRDGLYCPAADVWIDPNTPKPRALVTHGHADHARAGHGAVLATAETLAIMQARYGPQQQTQPVAYGEKIRLGGGVTACFHPAGHVLGSAQIALERGHERIVISGDYKRRRDPTCAPFEPVPCDIFITEATFALPVFRHPPAEQEIATLLRALAADPARCVLVGAYALGKAQRVIALLREAGHDAPIYLHGAILALSSLYESLGVALGDLRAAAGVPVGELKGRVVVAPPSALNDRWARRLPDPLTAMASGWMRVRQRARQRNVELPLVISDHADWDELTGTLGELRPAETWITHGRDDALAHWCGLNQMRARPLALIGREEDEAD